MLFCLAPAFGSMPSFALVPAPQNNRLEQVQIDSLTPPVKLFPKDSVGTLKAPEFANIREYVAAISRLPAKELSRRLTFPWKSQLEKVYAIHEWIVGSTYYDFSCMVTRECPMDAEAVIISGRTICVGYANLFVELCKFSGIEARYIGGYTAGGGHAWCSVRINNKWYLCDPTWGQEYFLMPPSEFFKTHYPDDYQWTLLQEYKTFEQFEKEMFADGFIAY